MEEKRQFLCGVVEGKREADFITDLLADHVIFFFFLLPRGDGFEQTTV